MDRTIYDLPHNVFGPTVSEWQLDVRGRSAGDSVTGAGQVVYSNLARWTARLDFSTTRRHRVLAWRAIMAKMRGRVNILRVGVCDMYRPKLTEMGLSAADAALITGDGIPHSTGAPFSTGVGHAFEPEAPVLATAPAGSTSITVNGGPIGNALQPGQYFSIDDWLYIVTGAESAGTTMTVTFEPPLRRQATSANVVRTNATALMAFETDTEGRLALTQGRFGAPSLSLVEWTSRP